MRYKWTDETFRKQIQDISPTIEVVGHYNGYNQKVECKCSTCGRVWSTTAGHLLKGQGCRNCYHKRRGEQSRITENEFLARLAQNSPNIDVISDYNGYNLPIKCRCRICGYEWESMPVRLVRGIGCSNCAGNLKRSPEEFISEMLNVNPLVKPLEPYNGLHTKIKCLCNQCGNTWYSAPVRLLNGQGCPSCAHTGTSFVEQFILHVFRDVFNEVHSRDRSAIGKELDIFIPEIKYAIEPGVWYVHKQKIENDREKVRLCADKGIHLTTVLYLFNGEAVPEGYGDLIVYKEDLAQEKNFRELKELAMSLLSRVDKKITVSEDQWRYYRRVTYIKSRKISPEEYRKKVAEVNPNITVISDYVSSVVSVKYRCNICGFENTVDPRGLLHSRSCLKCSGSLKKDTDLFRAEMSSVNPNIEILGDYTNAHSKIRCRCTICKNEWEAEPNTLLKGHGCPSCYNKRRGSSQRLTHEEFINRAKESQPQIIVLEEYRSTHEHLKCKCMKCGCVILKTPHALLAGQGCPWCAGKKKSKYIISKPPVS